VNSQPAGTASEYQYVRLNRFVGMDPGRLEAAIPLVRDELSPTLRAQHGCRSVFVGVDLEQGKGNVITFWDSESDMKAGDQVETQAREQAVALAGADMAQGLVDTYRIVLEEAPEQPAVDVGCARLSRWEGVSPARISEAVVKFEEVDLPHLRHFEGFRGVFISANPLLGNWLGMSLWRSRADLDATLDWEVEARERIEATSGSRPRKVLIDRYTVVVAPELQHFRTDYGEAIAQMLRPASSQ
jgi:hypothetical protein